MNRITTTLFLSVFCIFLFSCQNELDSKTEGADPVPPVQRAAPENAIELKPDANGNLVMQGGKTYVIREEVTATGFSGSSTSTSNPANLYIEGRLNFGYIGPIDDLIVPNGIFFTIDNGGSINIDNRLITLGSACSIYIRKGGMLGMFAGTFRYRDNATESTIINYGRVSLSTVSMFNVPFYNMPEGIVGICAFFTDGEVINYNDFHDCDGYQYGY